MLEVIIGEKAYKVEPGEAAGSIAVNGSHMDADVRSLGDGRFHMLINGRSVSIEVIDNNPKNPVIKVNGRLFQPVVKDDTDLLLERLGMNAKAKKEVRELKAPMPGLVLDIKVAPGDEVETGAPLVVLEAMKMENILKSPAQAKVKAIQVSRGDAIDKNTVLITFE